MALNIGIIGTGWVAAVHISALKKIPEAKVKAIAGRNITRAEELTHGLDSKVYSDYKIMLKKEYLDAVFILLPPHLHGEVEILCSESVPALLIEKPICNNIKIAEKILKVFNKAGTVVSAAYMNRYRRSVKYAKYLFGNEDNKPILAAGWWVTEMPPTLWWRSKEQSGGQFTEQCTHLVDISRWIVGEITDISAFTAKGFMTGINGYTVDDAITVNTRFASGALGCFSTGCYPKKGLDSKHSIELTISSGENLCRFTGWGMEMEAEYLNGKVEHLVSEDDIFEIEDREFLKAVKEKNNSYILSSYEDAMRTLRVTLAAEESARTGKIVRI